MEFIWNSIKDNNAEDFEWEVRKAVETALLGQMHLGSYAGYTCVPAGDRRVIIRIKDHDPNYNRISCEFDNDERIVGYITVQIGEPARTYGRAGNSREDVIDELGDRLVIIDVKDGQMSADVAGQIIGATTKFLNA